MSAPTWSDTSFIYLIDYILYEVFKITWSILSKDMKLILMITYQYKYILITSQTEILNFFIFKNIE